MNCKEFKDKLIKAIQCLEKESYMNSEKMSHLTSLEQEGTLRLKEEILNFTFDELEFYLKLKRVDDLSMYFFVDSTEEEARKGFGCREEIITFCNKLSQYLDSYGYYDAFVRFSIFPKHANIICVDDDSLDRLSRTLKENFQTMINEREIAEDKEKYGIFYNL